MTTFYYLTALVTGILCFGVIAISVFRLNLCGSRLRPRFKYTALILCASVAGCQPYLSSTLQGVGSLALVGSVIWLLVDGAPAWRQYAHKGGQEFDTQIFDPETFGEDE
ncbi:hypothetical protein [Saezia sanguinis]|uniref:hypothetical protein n=1 Tax=Saezia sanguinis TaxID=1965230 RepID=UPI003048203E